MTTMEQVLNNRVLVSMVIGVSLTAFLTWGYTSVDAIMLDRVFFFSALSVTASASILMIFAAIECFFYFEDDKV